MIREARTRIRDVAGPFRRMRSGVDGDEEGDGVVVVVVSLGLRECRGGGCKRGRRSRRSRIQAHRQLRQESGVVSSD